MPETGTGRGPKNVSGWTVDTYAAHNEALRAAEEKFQTERDRRYAEIKIEQEKALTIEKTAKSEALQLAREIQTYKDEKANELREQINSERGYYASKDDLAAAVGKLETALTPVLGYVAREQGKNQGISLSWAVVLGLVTMLLGLYALSQRVSSGPVAPVYYAPMVPGTLAPVPNGPPVMPR